MDNDDLVDYLIGKRYARDFADRVVAVYQGGMNAVKVLAKTLGVDGEHDYEHELVADIEAWRDMHDFKEFAIGL